MKEFNVFFIIDGDVVQNKITIFAESLEQVDDYNILIDGKTRINTANGISGVSVLSHSLGNEKWQLVKKP